LRAGWTVCSAARIQVGEVFRRGFLTGQVTNSRQRGDAGGRTRYAEATVFKTMQRMEADSPHAGQAPGGHGHESGWLLVERGRDLDGPSQASGHRAGVGMDRQSALDRRPLIFREGKTGVRDVDALDHEHLPLELDLPRRLPDQTGRIDSTGR
jgi:hypothetical protein